MLKSIHALLDEADAVVHYNGLNFDIPCLNKEFLIYGMSPPAPYKNVDLYRTVKNQFKFTSNKLDHVIQRLGLGAKVETTFQLWVDCMRGDSTAWEHMEKYNKQDVLVLEKLYNVLKAWVPNHPNRSLYTEATELMCPTCGSKKYHSRGSYYTTVGKYKRYQCQDCGKWFRGRDNMSYRQVLSV
jgi:DNA polymerase elongation subunit (family B)